MCWRKETLQTETQAVAVTPPPSIPLFGDEPDRTSIVLIKFFFTNPQLRPPGIPKRQAVQNQLGAGVIRKRDDKQMLVRATDKVVDQIHGGSKYTGGNESLARIGRLRQNRRDTGTLVYDNIRFVRTSSLPAELAGIGFAFTGIHWYRQHRPGKQDKWVVVVSFNDQSIEGAQKAVEPNQAESGAMTALCKMTWEGAYIWQNVTGVATINCLHLKPEGTPQHEVVIRDRSLTCSKV